MITGLSAKFQEELDSGSGKPSVVVQMQEDIIAVEESAQGDWENNTAENNVDYASRIGDVILTADTPPNQKNLIGNTWSLLYDVVSFPQLAVVTDNQNWQSFKHSIGFKQLNLVKGFFRYDAALTIRTVKCSIWDSTRTIQYGSPVAVSISSTTGAWETFDFSSQEIDILHNTEYWKKFELDTFTLDAIGIHGVDQKYQNTDVYANGQFDITGDFPGTDLGDLMFEVSLTGEYYLASGFIQTDEIDLGSVPTVEGEWQLSDIKPSDSVLAYEAWYSTTGAFAGEEVSIGAILDGDVITDLIRYWLVKATFTPNTNQYQTPVLRAIRADFTTYKSITNDLDLAPVENFETGLMSIQSSTTKVDTFAASTIGNQTLSFDFNASISKYLFSKFPKNKLVRIYLGFIAPGFAFSDYLLFFKGQILSYSIPSSDRVRISVQNYQINWDRKVPESWTDTGEDVIWTNIHPIDILLDLFKNYTEARDSEFVLSSFADVKAAIPTWQVTRTITATPSEVKKLAEELRISMSCIFIPQADGKIKIKRFDASEASVFSLSDANTKGIMYRGNLKSLINRTVIYYAHGEDGAGAYTTPEAGNKAEDFKELDLGLSASSQTDWNEIARHETKDKFTRSTDPTQIDAFRTDILDRFENPPSIIEVPSTGLDKMLIEAGDIVDVTTLRAPSVDGISGITAKKYQVVQHKLDFTKSVVSMMLLEV